MTRRSNMAAWATLSVALLTGLLAADVVYAQGAKPPPRKTIFEEKRLATRDGETIHCTYFPSVAGKKAPVAVLMHGEKGNRLVWQTGPGNTSGLAGALQQNEFAVLTVDLRKHGENIAGSGGAPAANKKSDPIKLLPRDYQRMVAFDLEAVKKFLLEEHENQKLNVNKLALVGADFSAAVALQYFELDWSKQPYDDAPVPAQRTPKGQDVRALVLLSPDTSVPGLSVTAATQQIRALNGFVSVMIGVGTKDDNDKGAAEKLADQISPPGIKKEGAAQYLFLEKYDTKLRGTDLLNKGLKVEVAMYNFLDKFVKNAPGEWRTRKSPLSD